MEKPNIKNLKKYLYKKPSQSELFLYCKSLREQGVVSENIINIIEEYRDEAEISLNDAEDDLLDEVLSTLLGYCHSSCSLK